MHTALHAHRPACTPPAADVSCALPPRLTPRTWAGSRAAWQCSPSLGYRCLCPPGHGGADCSAACPVECAAPRGRCVAGRCLCSVGWSGPGCDRPVCDKACSNHGTCTREGCRCDQGWDGQDCALRSCEHGCFAALGQGTCYGGRCVCAVGFSGPACNVTCGAVGGVVCSDRGFCGRGRTCECDPGYTGAHCEQRTCLMGCSGHGLCHDGTCVCALGYGGRDCATSTVPSPDDCSTGCVHICASRCSSSDPTTQAREPGCFTACRKRCFGACHSHSSQRQLWAEGRQWLPTEAMGASRMASKALGLPLPTAASLPGPAGQLATGAV